MSGISTHRLNECSRCRGCSAVRDVTSVRLASDKFSAIGILYGVREENVAFLEFSRHFRRHGLPVPQVYAEDLDRGAYLEADLGDTTLFDFLSQNRTGDDIAPKVVEAYGKAVATLPRFQIEAGRDLNYKVCYPRSSFDRQSIAWDLNYFKYYFLRLAGIPFNEQALENDFGRLTKFLLSASRDYFLYRDFQSRNVMWRDGNPFFLDYQGGRKGALQYDIASLLYDAKADLPPELRQQLLDHYLDELAGFIPLEREVFMQHFYAFVYVRMMQALGAYGFRGFYERKAHFLQSVPYALKNLRWLLHNVELPIALPTLMDSFQSMLGSDKLQSLAPGTGNVAVRIFSFSFHRGVVKDETGHGGGFVFDARSLPNPGREESFKDPDRQRRAGDRISQSAGERAPVPLQRHVAGGRQRERVSAARLQEPDGIVWLHRRPASLGVSGGATGKTLTWQEWRGGGSAAS